MRFFDQTWKPAESQQKAKQQFASPEQAGQGSKKVDLKGTTGSARWPWFSRSLRTQVPHDTFAYQPPQPVQTNGQLHRVQQAGLSNISSGTDAPAVGSDATVGKPGAQQNTRRDDTGNYPSAMDVLGEQCLTADMHSTLATIAQHPVWQRCIGFEPSDGVLEPQWQLLQQFAGNNVRAHTSCRYAG
jgi:hypothetical protein